VFVKLSAEMACKQEGALGRGRARCTRRTEQHASLLLAANVAFAIEKRAGTEKSKVHKWKSLGAAHSSSVTKLRGLVLGASQDVGTTLLPLKKTHEEHRFVASRL
jgi:hypothetical protein